MYEQNVVTESFIASTDLRSHQFKVVDLSGDFKVTLAAANKGYGVVHTGGNAGEHVSIATDGIVMVMAGAAVSRNEELTAAATGFVVTAASPTLAAGQMIIGTALIGVASGMLAPVRLRRYYRVASNV